MKKLLKLVMVILVIVAAAFLVAPWALSPPMGCGVSGPASTAANRVRQLLLASHVFCMEQAKESLSPRYPKTFSELVPTYLSEKDLEKLTANLQLNYFLPEGAPDEGQVIIVAHIPDYVIYGTAPFDVRWYKLK